MKTTVDISDPLLAEVRRAADREGTTLKALVEAGLRRVLLDGRIEGPRVHDARIAALCLLHGVSERWSADRDFSRFPELTVKNPLIG